MATEFPVHHRHAARNDGPASSDAVCLEVNGSVLRFAQASVSHGNIPGMCLTNLPCPGPLCPLILTVALNCAALTSRNHINMLVLLPLFLRVQIATRPVWLCRCAHHPVAQGALEEGYITTTARTEGPRRVLRGCASTLGQPLPLGSTGGTIGASETSPGRCYCSTWCAVTCAVPCSVYSTDGTVCMMQVGPGVEGLLESAGLCPGLSSWGYCRPLGTSAVGRRGGMIIAGV